jgi:hypothetical protein
MGIQNGYRIIGTWYRQEANERREMFKKIEKLGKANCLVESVEK